MWLLISLGWVCVDSLGVIWLCLLFGCFVCRVIVRFRCGLICLLDACGLYCGLVPCFCGCCVITVSVSCG